MPEEPRDPSVLGNLPRSRPGRRSDKRSSGAKRTASPATRSAASRARTKPKPAQAKRTASTKARTASKPAAARPSRPAAGRSQPSDPMSGAIRLAGQVAGAGLKVAGEVLKRLPGR
jgi:hypothetical protein